MKDSYNREWSEAENELDQFCKTHLITLVIEYRERNGRLGGNSATKVYCHHRAYFKKTGETIFEVNDNYPMSDAEILLKLKEYIRNKKIDQIL